MFRSVPQMFRLVLTRSFRARTVRVAMDATAPTPAPPEWLKRARKAAGFTNAKDFLAAVKAEQGTAPSYSSYAQWESGEDGRGGSPCGRHHRHGHRAWYALGRSVGLRP